MRNQDERMSYLKRKDGSLIYIIGDYKNGYHAQGDIYIGEDDLRRLVACWNACEGLETELLENVLMTGDSILSRFELRDKDDRELTAQRDELLTALKLAYKALDAIGDEMTVGERYTNAGQYLLDSLQPSIAAIAKAEGTKP